MTDLINKEIYKKQVDYYRRLSADCYDKAQRDFFNTKKWIDLEKYFEGVADAFQTLVLGEKNLQLKRRTKQTEKEVKE